MGPSVCSYEGNQGLKGPSGQPCKARDMAQMIKNLPSEHRVLGCIASTI